MIDFRTDCTDAKISNPPSKTLKPTAWHVGVLCQIPDGISECAGQLESAGLNQVRLFVRADTIVPDTCGRLPVSVMNDQLS